MQIHAEHEFAAPLSRVLQSLVRPDYASYLAASHPFFREVEVLSIERERDALVRRVRYRARPPFSHLGPVFIPRSWFVWVEHSRLDLRANVLSFENVPELESIRPKVVNRGTMRFDSVGAERCVRKASFEIDLVVSKSVQVLVELGIDLVSKQVSKSLDAEAQILAGWLSAQHSSITNGAQSASRALAS